jgi:hypothetical protein
MGINGASMIKRGNILLIKHRLDPLGWLIRHYTHSQFNHVAWIIDSANLIESGRYGIAIHPISKYNNSFLYMTKLIRLKNITSKRLNKAIKLISYFDKKPNYLKQLLTFLLLLLKYEGLLPKSTCSGLIAQALHKVGFTFNNKKPSRITPEDINQSKNVITIKK